MSDGLYKKLFNYFTGCINIMEINSSAIANDVNLNIATEIPNTVYWLRKSVSLTHLDKLKNQINNHQKNKHHDNKKIQKEKCFINIIPFITYGGKKKTKNHMVVSKSGNYCCAFSLKPKEIAHEKTKHYKLIFNNSKNNNKIAKSVYNPVSKMALNFNGEKLLFISDKKKNNKIKLLERIGNETDQKKLKLREQAHKQAGNKADFDTKKAIEKAYGLVDFKPIKHIPLKLSKLSKEKIHDVAFGADDSHLVAVAGVNDISIMYNVNCENNDGKNKTPVVWNKIFHCKYSSKIVNVAFSGATNLLFTLLENEQLIINKQIYKNNWSEVVKINGINSLPIDVDECGNLLYLDNKSLAIISYNEDTVKKTTVLEQKNIKITAASFIDASCVIVGVYDKLNGSHMFVFCEKQSIGWQVKKSGAAKKEILDLKRKYSPNIFYSSKQETTDTKETPLLNSIYALY